MWYRRENGVVVGGPYNCEQMFPVELLADDDPQVLAMLERAKPVPQVTLEDIVSVLTPIQKTALQARLDARK